MRDSATGRSRGFGFLTFKDPKTVNTVMVKEHFLDGKIVRATHFDESRERQDTLGSISRIHLHSLKRKHGDLLSGTQIDPKRAIPRDEQEKTAKIFVGGVSQDATEEDFEGFFAQFGRVIDATLMMDKDTGRPRGFGFVTFDSDAAVEKCLQFYPLEILGKPIEVKRAQPRGKMGEDEDFGRVRGRGKFGREDRFGSNDNNQPAQAAQNQTPNMMGGNSGMTPQMMAQYWQRMQQYFSMMQQQMAANMMGGMGGMGNMGMNPQQMQMMQMMQQQQKMQGGNSPNAQNAGMGNMQGMNPQMMQQMMNMQQGGMNGMNMGGGRPPMGPASMGGGQRQLSAQEQLAFEQQKYEQQHVRRQGGFPHGPRGGGFQGQHGQQQHGSGPQSWEGMYDDVPQPEGNAGGRGSAGPVRHNTPKPPKGPGGPAAPSAPANAPTGPKNPGNKPGGGFRGRGRYHPYGR
ncbi:heterogeneous nuclear ribonucleoprotein D0 [Cladophialophora carrionii]|uniref:Heterogeneous nuclear ribonucleoprotein D0 n=1 Tax=Cladophialophora carrionii TaxID=86049 RepID=A0A1C1CIH0_9EURO|nr:heterogeneous nuclear ribonucleoprotein D0 [Cladophialophora carrionii]